MPSFLIAYDVAHPKRLRRVAKTLERHASRLQYSVFWFQGKESSLGALLEQLRLLINVQEDVIQAWPLPPGISPEEFALGIARCINPVAVVLDGHTRLLPQSSESIPDPNPTKAETP